MDKIWDRKSFRSRRSLAVVAGMKKTNDHAEPTKVERLKKSLYYRQVEKDTELFIPHNSPTYTYLGRHTLTTPIGWISIDLPQNFVFICTSVNKDNIYWSNMCRWTAVYDVCPFLIFAYFFIFQYTYKRFNLIELFIALKVNQFDSLVKV